MIHTIVAAALGDRDPQAAETRRRCGAVAGGIGILLNVLLFAGKLTAGLLTASVAMIADAVNNLSDAASSVVTLIGFHLASQAADAEHPFGHGRMEYVSGLIVSLAILLMGFEVGRSALETLLHPEDTAFRPLALVILAAAIGVKLWMYFFNRAMGRALKSAAMEATAADSLSDVASTLVVLLSALADRFLSLRLDGLAGLLVAAFILKTGWDAARETLDPLLGRPMPREIAQDIQSVVDRYPQILGIHDLIYHDYGPGRAMMSFHAEVPAEGDLLELHDLIDGVERELKGKYHIETTIHMDPVVRDARTDAIRRQVENIVQGLDPVLTIHDLRITPGPSHTNVLFDVVAPYGFRLTDRQICTELTWQLKKRSPRYYPVIQVDHSYVVQEKDG